VTQLVAVDWSGRATGAAEAIWLARVVDGRLVELDNGRDRGAVIDRIVAIARAEPRTAVGLDFAFGFPAWYAAENGWTSGRAVWDAIAGRAEALLADCRPPFWGRPGTRAQTLGEAYRRTERALSARPKSIFQVGGAGAVGTGSLRGMAQLARLADAGFSIWPFDDPGWPLVVEVYPRLFAPRGLVKGRHRARREHLEQRFPEQSDALRERAAGSEDAFDAAITALAMAEHAGDLDALPRVPLDAPERLEGAIWRPAPSDVPTR